MTDNYGCPYNYVEYGPCISPPKLSTDSILSLITKTLFLQPPTKKTFTSTVLSPSVTISDIEIFIANLALMSHSLSHPLSQITPSCSSRSSSPHTVTYPPLPYPLPLLLHLPHHLHSLLLSSHFFSYIYHKISSCLSFTYWILVNPCYIIHPSHSTVAPQWCSG